MSCIIWDETASIEQDRLEVQELPAGPPDRLPATSAGPTEDPYPAAVARALSGIVGALAVLVLSAWIVDRPWLATFPINASTMAVNTALAFLVAAAALVLLLRTDRSPVP